MSLLEQDVKAVLNTKEGRSVLLQIMLVSGWEANPYFPGDTHKTAFNCGQKSIAQYLQQLIMQADPTRLAQMLQEREDLHRQYEQAKQQSMAQAAAQAPTQQVKVAAK